MKRRSGLRLRLLVLVLVAVLPLFGFSVYWALRDEALQLEHTRESLRGVAASEAARYGRTVESARQLLLATARSADVRLGRPGDCQEYLLRLREIIPAYDNFGVIDLDGMVRCDTRSFAGRYVKPAALGYFSLALGANGFAVGEYMVGELSGKPLLGFGYPVTDARGAVTGVAFATIRLLDIQRELQSAVVPASGTVAVLDRRGRVLASTDPALPMGATLAAGALADAMREGGPATGDVAGADDVAGGPRRIRAMAPAPGAGATALSVLVSVDVAAVVQPGRSQLLYQLAALGLVTSMSTMLGWIYAGRAIVRPTRDILDFTAQLGRGEFGARLSPRGSGNELEQIAQSLNGMAQALEHRAKALAGAVTENARVRATQNLILNNMREGVIAIDTRRRFLLFNEAAGRLFMPPEGQKDIGHYQPELAGLLKPDTLEPFAAHELPLDRALQGESGSDFPLMVKNPRVPEGRLLRGNYRPIHGPDGIVGALAVFTDVTEREAREQRRLAAEQEVREHAARLAVAAVENARLLDEVQHLNQDLERKVDERTKALHQSNRELETFSYSVSHDLRSPLRTVDGFSKLLEKDLKTNEGKKAGHYISRIQSAATHMGQLIDGLLALAHVSRQTLVMSTVDLSGLAAEIIERFARLEPERTVVVDIQPGMAATGDARLLAALLQNLLANAWKFSGRKADARIAFGCSKEPGQAAVYFVRDNGAGFDMAQAGRLFGTFERLHGEAEFAGTGIGLATVKRIVERHGGGIRAESAVGEGACFFFTLQA